MSLVTAKEEINSPMLPDGETSAIRIVRIVDGSVINYAHQLRLMDGFLDALETFWDGGKLQVCLLAPNDMVNRFESDLFSPPSVELEVQPISKLMSMMDESFVNSLDKIALRFLMLLHIAAERPKEFTLVVDADVFPINIVSQTRLFKLAKEYLAKSDDYAVGTPIGLFSGKIAESWLKAADKEIELQATKRRRALAEACSSAEILFWRVTKDYQPLCEIVPETKWRKLAETGWDLQPWKQPNHHPFVSLRGIGEDPETGLSVVYAALHR
jgi:hypothetical protein